MKKINEIILIIEHSDKSAGTEASDASFSNLFTCKLD